MTTRSKSDKNEIESQYNSALQAENKKKAKSDTSNTLYTSTPAPSSTRVPKRISFENNEPESQASFLPSAPECGSDDSGDETVRPVTKSESLNSELKSSVNSKKSKIMTQNNPFATLKYAVEAVPFFDGKNIPLNYFIEGCEEAKSMLPSEAESQFTKILRTRIVGEARRTIRDQDFDTVAKLTKYLKQIYGGSKNVYQLQGELGGIYQKNDEDVITYANRVKLLGKQIREAYRSSEYAGQDIRASLEKDMCKCFIRGLKSEIEQRIARDLDVEATVSDALRIERELRAISDLRYGPSNSGQNSRPTETCQICFKLGHTAAGCRKLADSSKQNNLGTEILICQICKKRGHGADKCRLRDPQARRPITMVQEKVVNCQMCLKPGHSAKNCRLNNYNSQPNNHNNRLSIICQWCDRPGHSASNCWKRQNRQTNSDNQNKISCQICNNVGHIAKNCRSNSNQKLNPENTHFCRYCKENGHLIENCQRRIANNNRARENNSGNGNGPSKSGVPQGSDQTSRPSTSRKDA